MHYADFLFCVKFVHVFTRMNSEHAQNSRRLTWWPHECRLPLPIIGRLLPLREDYTSYWKFNGANIFILLLVIWKATVASVKSCRYDVLSCRAQLKSSYGWKLWPDLSLKKPKHRVISAYVWKVGSVNYLQKPAVTNYDQIDKVTHWWALLEFKG